METKEMTRAEAPAAQETPNRTVMLWSWWRSKDQTRKFAVVDKLLKGVTRDVRTVGIMLLEVGDSNPFYYDVEEFFQLVDKGAMVELYPTKKETKIV